MNGGAAEVGAPEVIRNNAVLAAEQYRRAVELVARSKGELLAAVDRERSVIKLSGVAVVAGVDENTLRQWLYRHRRNGRKGKDHGGK